MSDVLQTWTFYISRKMSYNQRIGYTLWYTCPTLREGFKLFLKQSHIWKKNIRFIDFLDPFEMSWKLYFLLPVDKICFILICTTFDQGGRGLWMINKSSPKIPIVDQKQSTFQSFPNIFLISKAEYHTKILSIYNGFIITSMYWRFSYSRF